MNKRIAEIQTLAKKAKYGTVFEISRDEYVREVTEADPESFVVLHLYQGYNEASLLVNRFLDQLAPKYPLVNCSSLRLNSLRLSRRSVLRISLIRVFLVF